MRPGIIVQHGRLPARSRELVRCDITAIIGFVPRERWPEETIAGDFVEVILRREADLWSYPDWQQFDRASQRAVRDYFINGGEVLHLIGVYIDTVADLQVTASDHGVLGPLLDRLRTEDDISILAAPAAAYLSCEISRTGVVRADAEPLYELLLAHCREMHNRFLIIDPPSGLHEDLLSRWVSGFRSRNELTRSFGALYYPWLCEGEERFPPSASLAGIFVRTEREKGEYGVVWPPANTPILGVTHPEVELDWAEAGGLAEQSINPLILQAGRGVVVFGARTLSRERAFAYVNSRRVVSLITEQIRRDSEWAVFETNNPHLWDVLHRDIRYRLEQFWRGGLLAGDRPGEEYAVLCDKTNNPRTSLDMGQVNVEVRLRPVGTTEQIVIDLRLGE
jgi:hypothetical protein